jgi:hypothetical protein
MDRDVRATEALAFHDETISASYRGIASGVAK